MTLFSKALVIVSLTMVPNFLLAQSGSGNPDDSANGSAAGTKKCIWRCKKEEAPKEVPKESPVLNGILNSPLPESLEAEKKAALTQLAYDMTARLREIDVQLKNHADLSSEELNSLNESTYKLLADTQVKLGINPKVLLREKFSTPITFPNGATTFSHLDETQRDAVVETIQNFRGGLYMDLIRLWKRVALVYSKALYVTYERSGHFLADDRNQILRILTMATVIPMPVVDRAGKTIKVFEHEVAQPEFVRAFNRAIQIFTIESPKLQMNDEQFNKHKEAAIQSIAGVTKTVDTGVNGTLVNIGGHWHHANYQKCVQHAGNVLFGTALSNAILFCFDKFKVEFTTFEVCRNSASHLVGSAYTNAAQYCFDRFNK